MQKSEYGHKPIRNEQTGMPPKAPVPTAKKYNVILVTNRPTAEVLHQISEHFGAGVVDLFNNVTVFRPAGYSSLDTTVAYDFAIIDEAKWIASFRTLVNIPVVTITAMTEVDPNILLLFINDAINDHNRETKG